MYTFLQDFICHRKHQNKREKCKGKKVGDLWVCCDQRTTTVWKIMMVERRKGKKNKMLCFLHLMLLFTRLILYTRVNRENKWSMKKWNTQRIKQGSWVADDEDGVRQKRLFSNCKILRYSGGWWQIGNGKERERLTRNIAPFSTCPHKSHQHQNRKKEKPPGTLWKNSQPPPQQQLYSYYLFHVKSYYFM